MGEVARVGMFGKSNPARSSDEHLQATMSGGL